MKKILIVSSDRRLLKLLDRELSYRDYVVLAEDDPDHIFSDIQLFEPDLLIADLILDEYNGGAICHQVKSDPGTREIPVIILCESELETHYPSRFGCDIVIQKTDEIFPLLDAIYEIFEEKRAAFL